MTEEIQFVCSVCGVGYKEDTGNVTTQLIELVKIPFQEQNQGKFTVV